MTAFEERAAGPGAEPVTDGLLSLDGLFRALVKIEMGLRRMGMREGDDPADGRFSDAHEKRVLYELVASGGLRHLRSLVKGLGEIIPALDVQHAAGPWVPGEPPEECKASKQPVLVAVDGGRPEVVWWNPQLRVFHGEEGGWDNYGGGVDHLDILFHARINPPKQEGGEW